MQQNRAIYINETVHIKGPKGTQQLSKGQTFVVERDLADRLIADNKGFDITPKSICIHVLEALKEWSTFEPHVEAVN